MLGEKIRQYRKAMEPKTSGEKLAELAGLSAVTIYNLEKGKIPEVKVDTIERIAHAMNIPIGLLLDDQATISAWKSFMMFREMIAAENPAKYATTEIEPKKKRSSHAGDANPRTHSIRKTGT